MPDLEIEQLEGCWVLRLRVSPGAKASRILGVHGGALKVAVREPAEAGRANAAVQRLLAQALGLKSGAVELAVGKASRDKKVRIRGYPGDRNDLASRLVGPLLDDVGRDSSGPP
jgi:uncharacterized protein